MRSNYKYRKDTRTDKQFAEDIFNRTLRQRFLIELFRKECQYRNKQIAILDYGADNSGKVLTKSASAKPDYRVIIDGQEYLVEVQCSPVAFKWTFKISNLRDYIKYQACILIFYGVGFSTEQDPKTIDYEETMWGWIPTEKIQLMIDNYRPFKSSSFGSKPCIEIPSKDFIKFITPYELEHILPK